ncbi:hypothetical protein DFH29DRAFT_879719 [Suillus ampliporus]|nr:hypothetical protein DFH29DRAFT_879719 [Suillus ampliporus]
MLTFQEALIDESPTDAPSTQPSIADPSAPALPQGPGIRPNDYLLYNARWIHKQTICRLIINKDFVSKSLNRLERVRTGYTKVNKLIDMSAGRIMDQNLLLVGDMVLTILRSDHTLSVGVLRSTAITLNSVSRASINVGVLKAIRTTAKITGQLLTVIPTSPVSPDVPQSLLWDGGYVTARSVIQGTSKFTECVVIVTVPGALVEPINPEAIFIWLRDDVDSDKFTQVNGGQSTWKISRDAMQAACELLWAKAVELKVSLKSIAAVTPSDTKTFPYRLSDGTPAVVLHEANAQLAASEGERITVCPLCEANVCDMHAHMGLHILQALSNTPEELTLKKTVGDMLPCGFCGCSGIPACAITIKVPANGAPVWETKCMYQHTFRYGFAENGSKNKPCRNVPLKCELCHPILPPEPGKTSRRTIVAAVDAVWRYNMPEHVLSQHEEYSLPGWREAGIPLPARVWKGMKLTDLEQSASHVPKEQWQASYGVGSEQDKENISASSSRPFKRPALESTTSMPSK